MPITARPTIGRFFDDFFVGEKITHNLSKTIFESDNNLFSLLTMNHHPVHIDQNYATSGQHGEILVVGTLVFSLAVGISVPDISGKAIANLEYIGVKHLAPVFVDDTIYCDSEILEMKPSVSKTDRGVIYVKTIVQNQNDVRVLEFERRVLVKRRLVDE